MSQINNFSTLSKGLTSPLDASASVTPHDTNALAFVPRAVWVGGAGNIAVRLPGDAADVTIQNVSAGTLLPIRPTHIRATGTTATNMIILQ